MKRPRSPSPPSDRIAARWGVEFPTPRITDLQRRTAFAKPKELSHFSYTPARTLLLNDNSALVPLKLKQATFQDRSLPVDLNKGYDKYIQRDDTPERLDALLKVMQTLDAKPHFCTWRGIITKIICTPYSRQGSSDDWELGATLYNKTIYLEEHKSMEKRFGDSEYQRKACFYGYKFETAFTQPESKLDTERNDDEEETNTNIQYCSVFKTALGKHSLVLGGEVDCLEYMELKTHKTMKHEHMRQTFIKNKLMKTWAQSYLAGIPSILFGFHTNGVVDSIKRYRTEELPRLARNKDGCVWDPNVMLSFGDWVLSILAKHVVIDDPEVVYTITFKQGVLYVSGGRRGGDDVFVHQWFVDGIV